MSQLALWNQTLHLLSHDYFERKEQFHLAEDSYSVWVLFAIESGKFYFRIGDEWGEAGPGDLVFCPPEFQFKREMVSPLSLHYIRFKFRNEAQIKPFQQIPSFLSQPRDNKRLDSDFSHLRKYRYASDPRSISRKQMILNDFWQLACDVWEKELQHEDSLKLPISGDERMNYAADWLYEKAFRRFSIGDLSNSLNLSPVQFTRRFRKAFGISPSDYVRSLRMSKVSELLRDTEMTLDQIAAQCGYDNGLYLSRVFTNNTGMSPSTYRERGVQYDYCSS